MTHMLGVINLASLLWQHYEMCCSHRLNVVEHNALLILIQNSYFCALSLNDQIKSRLTTIGLCNFCYFLQSARLNCLLILLRRQFCLLLFDRKQSLVALKLDVQTLWINRIDLLLQLASQRVRFNLELEDEGILWASAHLAEVFYFFHVVS